MSQIKLRVYDISHGLAKQLSMAFIGRQIDVVPHTGVEVFGKEFFFGGGIVVSAPERVEAEFGITPVQVRAWNGRWGAVGTQPTRRARCWIWARRPSR